MSDHKNSDLGGREGVAPYEVRPRKNRWGLWIGLGAAGLFILLLGTCAWTFSNLWTDNVDRQAATQEFIAQVYATGLPQADDPAYHPQFGATQEQIDKVSQLVDRFGQPLETGETTCVTAVSANTDPLQNGKRSECYTPMQFKGTGGRINVIWKKDGEDWKVFYFGINLNDVTAADMTPPVESDVRAEDVLGKNSSD